MTKTYREVIQFVNAATTYVSQNHDENKLKYALTKTQKSAAKVVETYNEKLEDLRIDHCSVDEKGTILRDANGNYLFGRDGLRALVQGQRVLNNQGVEVQEHITEIPENFDENYREAFTGFVFQNGSEPNI